MAEFFDKTDTTLIEGFEEVDITFVKTEGNFRKEKFISGSVQFPVGDCACVKKTVYPRQFCRGYYV
jgi:hypothetical protein